MAKSLRPLEAFPDGPSAAHEVGHSLECLAAALLPDRLSRP